MFLNLFLLVPLFLLPTSIIQVLNCTDISNPVSCTTLCYQQSDTLYYLYVNNAWVQLNDTHWLDDAKAKCGAGPDMPTYEGGGKQQTQ